MLRRRWRRDRSCSREEFTELSTVSSGGILIRTSWSSADATGVSTSGRTCIGSTTSSLAVRCLSLLCCISSSPCICSCPCSSLYSSLSSLFWRLCLCLSVWLDGAGFCRKCARAARPPTTAAPTAAPPTATAVEDTPSSFFFRSAMVCRVAASAGVADTEGYRTAMKRGVAVRVPVPRIDG